MNGSRLSVPARRTACRDSACRSAAGSAVQLPARWSDPKRTTMEAWHGNPDQFFCAPTNVHVLRAQGGLVHLFGKHTPSSVRWCVWSLPPIGAARHKLGGVVAQFFSSRTWDSRTTGLGAAVSRNRCHYPFHRAHTNLIFGKWIHPSHAFGECAAGDTLTWSGSYHATLRSIGERTFRRAAVAGS